MADLPALPPTSQPPAADPNPPPAVVADQVEDAKGALDEAEKKLKQSKTVEEIQGMSDAMGHALLEEIRGVREILQSLPAPQQELPGVVQLKKARWLPW